MLAIIHFFLDYCIMDMPQVWKFMSNSVCHDQMIFINKFVLKNKLLILN